MGTVVNTFQSLLGIHQVVPWSSLSETRFEIETDDLSLVYPESIEQLSAVVRTCHDRGWRMVSCGQRSKLHWGCQQHLKADVVISTARLNRLVEHWVDDFTARVEAGMGFTDLQTTLQAQGQFWPVDPLYGRRATVGGIVATADGGSLRQRYGSVRDTVIGIEFVRHDGEVVKAGGRVVKNVAGYDLMKLMTGAYGTLGILSQITLRLYPIAPQSETLVLSGTAAAITEAALQTRLQGLTPSAMDIIGTGDSLRGTGDSLRDTGGSLQLAGRFQGIAAGVNEQIGRFQVLGEQLGLTSQRVDDGPFWHTLALELANPNIVLCKVGLLPTQLVPLLQLMAQRPTGWLGRLHNATGLGLLALTADTEDLNAMVKTLRSHCAAHQGYLTILQGPKSLTLDPWGYGGNALKTMKAIKQKFDPDGIINPGRFVGGI